MIANLIVVTLMSMFHMATIHKLYMWMYGDLGPYVSVISYVTVMVFTAVDLTTRKADGKEWQE